MLTQWALAESAGFVLAGLDLPELVVVAGMAWVGVLASAVEASGALQTNAVQASGSQSHVPWEVDNPYHSI